jgi:hypothetical protein
MDVCVRLKQHNAVRILDKKNQHIRLTTAQMQVHDTLLCEQGILVPINTCSIVGFQNPAAALYAFDNFVKFVAKVLELANACEVLELYDVNRLGLGLDTLQSLPMN